VSKGWIHGSTRAWRATRARVLTRDGFLCQLKIRGVCTVDAPMRGGHAHHVHGKESGCVGCAADRMDHLVATCAACNLHVGEPAAGDPPNRGVTKW
jgi:5-methylcytosine-specific restriction endonuclease McrA